MHLKHLVFWLAMPCAIAQEQPAAKTLADLVDDSPRVEFCANPSNKGIVAAYLESEPSRGELKVLQQTKGKIDWEYSFPHIYSEWRGDQVLSFRWITLSQVESPVIEVIEVTRRGNGSIFLLEPQGRELRLLLHTTACGGLFENEELEAFGVPLNGTAHIKERHLKVEYAQINGGDSDSVILTGTLEIANVVGRKQPDKKYEQKCLWDAEKRVFIPASPTSP